jgi:hypothetical protein
MSQKAYGRSIISSAKKAVSKGEPADEFIQSENNATPSEDTRADTFTLSGQQVAEIYSVEQILKRLIQIDYETMVNLTEESCGVLNQWYELFIAFPETYSMLMDKEEIVGYWHFVCLDDIHFEKAKRGELIDIDITIDTVEHMYLPDVYRGYLIGIAILPKYRSARNLQLLLNSFVKQLEGFAEHGIFIFEWCANAFTKEGKAMCKSLKMKKLCDNILDGEMYYSEFSSMMDLKFVKNSLRLIELYNKHFETESD